MAILRGNHAPNLWSNAAVWANGKVPVSSSTLDIQLNQASTDDLGTAQTPFVARDVIGAAIGVTHPSLSVTGFLHALDIENLSALDITSNNNVTVGASLINIPNVDVENGSVLNVGLGLTNVKHVTMGSGGKVDVHHGVVGTTFSFGAGGGTLILDNPPGTNLADTIALGIVTVGSPDIVELGHLNFTGAKFVPSVANPSVGGIDFTVSGKTGPTTVYRLDHVTGVVPFTIGVDPATGYHFISFHA